MSTKPTCITRRRRGFALIVALVFVMVVVGLVAIVGHATIRFARNDRRESDSMVARQLIDSGAAWARLHATDWPSTNGPTGAVTLDVAGLLPESLDGSLTLVPRSDTSGAMTEVEVRATIHRPNRWTIKRVVIVLTSPPSHRTTVPPSGRDSPPT